MWVTYTFGTIPSVNTSVVPPSTYQFQVPFPGIANYRKLPPGGWWFWTPLCLCTSTKESNLLHYTEELLGRKMPHACKALFWNGRRTKIRKAGQGSISPKVITRRYYLIGKAAACRGGGRRVKRRDTKFGIRKTQVICMIPRLSKGLVNILTLLTILQEIGLGLVTKCGCSSKARHNSAKMWPL